MKKIYYYLMALVVIFGLAACSDDDSPKLSGVESGVLSLDAGSIDGTNTKYTFTWTNTRFYLDDDYQRHVSLVGYEKNGVDYHLMGVETGRDMSEAVDFGSVVSASHLTLDYEAIAKIMVDNFGMVRSATEEKQANIDFQLMAKYASPDSSTVKSDVITVPFTLTVTPPVEGDKAKLFISRIPIGLTILTFMPGLQVKATPTSSVVGVAIRLRALPQQDLTATSITRFL